MGQNTPPEDLIAQSAPQRAWYSEANVYGWFRSLIGVSRNGDLFRLRTDWRKPLQ